jgi:site-specific recombinase XerD
MQKAWGSTHPSSTQSIIYTYQLLQSVDGFLLTCRIEGKSPKTIVYYKGILDRFTWFLNENCVKEINTSVIRSFLGYVQSTEHRWGSNNSRANCKVKQITVKRYYMGLKVFFNWCLNEGYMENSPLATLKKPKAPKKIVKAVCPADIEKLLRHTKGRDFYSTRK